MAFFPAFSLLAALIQPTYPRYRRCCMLGGGLSKLARRLFVSNKALRAVLRNAARHLAAVCASIFEHCVE
jgi:hypothetical protein